MSRVFLSSTIEDLKLERNILLNISNRVGVAAILQEHFGARPYPAIETIVKAMSTGECNIYVLVIGPRYGSLVPADRLPAFLDYPKKPNISYCEMEFDLATHLRIKRLVYVKERSAKIAGDIDKEQAKRREAFIQKVADSGCTYCKFARPIDLAIQATADIKDIISECEYRRHAMGPEYDL